LNDFYDQWDIRTFRGQLKANLSGGVPFVNNLTFFLGVRYLNEDSYLPFGYSLQRESMGKLLYKFSPSVKLSFMAKTTQDSYQPYSHSFKYRPEHYSIYDRSSLFGDMVFSHTLDDKTFYTVRASYYDQTYRRQVRDRYVDIPSLLAREAGDTSAVLNTNYGQPDSWAGEFNYIGDDSYIPDEKTSSLSILAEITSQIDPHHLIKAGGEVTKNNVDRMWFQEAWVGGNHEYQKYIRKPLEMAGYIQDKIEYEFLIINLGLRFDYFDPKTTMFPNIFDPGYVDETSTFRYYPEVPAPAQWRFSPRIGLAHPVSEDLVLHFAYGHFFQRADYQDMYYLHDILRVLSVIGNPTMKPQRTQAFEFGVKQQIGGLFAIDFSLYYKDIFNLSGSSFQIYYPHDYAIYDNSDYANVKGFEITLQKRYSHYFSGNFNYTFLIAQGNENSAREGAIRYWGSTDNRLRPRRAFPLNWDRTHTFSLIVDFSIPKGEGPSLFGVKALENISANFIGQAKSGLPYTPAGIVHPEFDLSTTQNSGRMPWTYRVDMQLEKAFHFAGMSYSPYLKIINLFNTANIQSIYTLTGKPWDAGPTTNLSQDFQRDPTAYEAPRQVFLGVRLGW
jgi:outer membrane receptor protein involved in Fe transport